jgi:hypothetical protein
MSGKVGEDRTYSADRHLIGGECTGFVRADDRCAAKCLDGWKRADDGILLGHTTCSQCQTSGDDSWQTLGDSSHSYKDRERAEEVMTTISEVAINEPRATAILK